MKRALPWIGTGLCAALVAVAALAFGAAANAADTAEGSLAGARDLYDARVEVAEAQKKLGESDVEDAITSAGKANATAERAQRVTREIAALLEESQAVAAELTRSSERSVSATTFARRQSQVAALLLEAIAGYQRDAYRYAGLTNAALERILAASRRTNESFPGRP